jgi:hypothetical protein
MATLVALGRIAEADGDDAEARRRYREVSHFGPGPDAEQAMADARDGLGRTGG